MKTQKELNVVHFEDFSDDQEYLRGLELLNQKEGMTNLQINHFFEKAANEFEEKVNYELARQAVILDVFRYSNVAVVVALMVVFIMIPLVNVVAGGESISFGQGYERIFSAY